MSAAIWIPLALCGVGVTAFTIVGAWAHKAFGGVRASMLTADDHEWEAPR